MTSNRTVLLMPAPLTMISVAPKPCAVTSPALSVVAPLRLARAHLANGDPEAAKLAYEVFFERMEDADEGIPEIEKAREEYAALTG